MICRTDTTAQSELGNYFSEHPKNARTKRYLHNRLARDMAFQDPTFGMVSLGLAHYGVWRGNFLKGGGMAVRAVLGPAAARAVLGPSAVRAVLGPSEPC